MKKIFATFAIILFILSAVPVFAEDDTLGIKTQEKLRIAEGQNTNLGINTKIEADEKLRIASDTKVRIDTRKTELRRCQLSDTEECKTIREDAREDAKTYLENLAEAIKARLEKLKEKVEDSERLNEARLLAHSLLEGVIAAENLEEIHLRKAPRILGKEQEKFS